MVDWLWDGFNALVLSYGQTGAGKTSLVLGRDPRPPHPTNAVTSSDPRPANDSDSRTSNRSTPGHHSDCNGASEDGECCTEGGLLKDILRVLFDNVHAASTSSSIAAADPPRTPTQAGAGDQTPRGDGFVSHCNDSGAVDVAQAAIEGENAARNVVRGGGAASQTVSRVTPKTTDEYANSNTFGEDGAETQASTRCSIPSNNRYTIAFSAWTVIGKTVVDLLSTNPNSRCPVDSHAGKSKSTAEHVASTGNEDSKSGTVSGEGTKAGGLGRGSRGSRVRNGEHSGGDGVSRRRRRRRSGSGDSSSGSGHHHSSGYHRLGGPPGYPDGFLTVQAPDFATALALLSIAKQRSVEWRPPKSGSRDAGGDGGAKGVGSGREGGGATHEKTAGGGPVGHVFFRVVLYNEAEETASTLHVVDLTGGWEVSIRKRKERGGCGDLL